MSRHRHQIQKMSHPCFFTCTVVGSVPVFHDPELAQRVLDVCRLLQDQGRLTVYGYAILEDRVHLVASAGDLPKAIEALKSTAGSRIVEFLQSQQSRSVLRQLNRCQAEDQAEDSYRLWEDGDPPEPIHNRETMQEKLDFVHRNPVQRGYVSDPTQWRYSSARDYAGQPGLLPVATDW